MTLQHPHRHASSQDALQELDVAQLDAVSGGDCVYASQNYSDGAILKVGDRYIQCQNDTWRMIP